MRSASSRHIEVGRRPLPLLVDRGVVPNFLARWTPGVGMMRSVFGRARTRACARGNYAGGGQRRPRNALTDVALRKEGESLSTVLVLVFVLHWCYAGIVPVAFQRHGVVALLPKLWQTRVLPVPCQYSRSTVPVQESA